MDFETLAQDLSAPLTGDVSISVIDTHAVLDVPTDELIAVRAALTEVRPSVRVMSEGEILDIYKEVGLPKDVAARFDLSAMTGTHGIGHTRWQQNQP